MTTTADHRPVIAGGSSRHAEALLDVLTALHTRVAPAHSLADAFVALAAVAADCIPEADYVSVGMRRGHRRPRTVASTHPTAIVADELQYAQECGPCVDAIEGEDGVVRCGELRRDPRWPALSGTRPELRVNSVMAVPLVIGQDAVEVTANVYALSENAFGDDAYAVAQFVALHGASYLSSVAAAEKVRNLSEALETSREIGMAMGILMLGRKINADAAFDLLRTMSQHSHRKLRDVARDIAETGALDAPDAPSHSRSRPHRVMGSGERYLTGTHR